MADTMQFDLVSPERRLASVQANEVQIPGAEGDMTALPDHAPTITTLRPGILRVVHAGGTDEYIVSGGFAEITGTSVSVLAEQSVHKGEVTQAFYDKILSEARAAYAKAQETFKNQPGPVDDAVKMLADMVAMGDHIGLTAGDTGPHSS
jgi:F-type H+-transporting ATPase subunit epsilon